MKVTPPEGAPQPTLGPTGLGGSTSVPDAADIPIAGGYYGAGNVEDALAAIAAELAALEGTTETSYWSSIITLQSGPTAGTSAHLADTIDAHDASAISFTPTGTIAATNVQAAIAEVALEAAPVDHQHIGGVTFSGDAVTTAFELPAAPFDEYSIDAYVAGTRTEVTLSGTMLTTMTFAAAPAAAADNIKVHIVAVAV